MSETRQCKGKLTPIPFKEGEDLWDLKYRLLQEHNCTTPEFKNVRDRFDDMLSDQYFVRDGIIYKIHNVSMGDEICEAIENEDGSISPAYIEDDVKCFTMPMKEVDGKMTPVGGSISSIKLNIKK